MLGTDPQIELLFSRWNMLLSPTFKVIEERPSDVLYMSCMKVILFMIV